MTHETIHWAAVLWLDGPQLAFAYLAETLDLSYGLILVVVVLSIAAWGIVFGYPNHATLYTTIALDMAGWILLKPKKK